MTELATASARGVRWDLSDLFAGPGDPAWGAALERSLAEAASFERRYRGTIAVPRGPTAGHLAGALRELETLHDGSSRAQVFARLRRKIEPDPDRPRFLLTIRGVGYTFQTRPRPVA